MSCCGRGQSTGVRGPFGGSSVQIRGGLIVAEDSDVGAATVGERWRTERGF
jgi:hypothetical protein